MKDIQKTNVKFTLKEEGSTKRIIICDKMSLIHQNWEKHVLPTADYFKLKKETKKRAQNVVGLGLAE